MDLSSEDCSVLSDHLDCSAADASSLDCSSSASHPIPLTCSSASFPASCPHSSCSGAHPSISTAATRPPSSHPSGFSWGPITEPGTPPPSEPSHGLSLGGLGGKCAGKILEGSVERGGLTGSGCGASSVDEDSDDTALVSYNPFLSKPRIHQVGNSSPFNTEGHSGSQIPCLEYVSSESHDRNESTTNNGEESCDPKCRYRPGCDVCGQWRKEESGSQTQSRTHSSSTQQSLYAIPESRSCTSSLSTCHPSPPPSPCDFTVRSRGGVASHHPTQSVGSSSAADCSTDRRQYPSASNSYPPSSCLVLRPAKHRKQVHSENPLRSRAINHSIPNHLENRAVIYNLVYSSPHSPSSSSTSQYLSANAPPSSESRQSRPSAAAATAHILPRESNDRFQSYSSPSPPSPPPSPPPGSQSQTPYSVVPQPFIPGLYVLQIAMGANHCLALVKGGSIFACGSNSLGQLGIGSTLNHRFRNDPKGNGDVVSVVHPISRNQSVISPHPAYLETYEHVAVLDPRSTPVVKVAAGSYHSLALTKDGRVYAWGDGGVGQLGLREVQTISKHLAAAAAAAETEAATATTGDGGGGEEGEGHRENGREEEEEKEEGESTVSFFKSTVIVRTPQLVTLYPPPDDPSGSNPDPTTAAIVTSTASSENRLRRPETDYRLVAIKAGKSHSELTNSKGTIWFFGQESNTGSNAARLKIHWIPTVVAKGLATEPIEWREETGREREEKDAKRNEEADARQKRISAARIEEQERAGERGDEEDEDSEMTEVHTDDSKSVIFVLDEDLLGEEEDEEKVVVIEEEEFVEEEKEEEEEGGAYADDADDDDENLIYDPEKESLSETDDDQVVEVETDDEIGGAAGRERWITKMYGSEEAGCSGSGRRRRIVGPFLSLGIVSSTGEVKVSASTTAISSHSSLPPNAQEVHWTSSDDGDDESVDDGDPKVVGHEKSDYQNRITVHHACVDENNDRKSSDSNDSLHQRKAAESSRAKRPKRPPHTAEGSESLAWRVVRRKEGMGKEKGKVVVLNIAASSIPVSVHPLPPSPPTPPPFTSLGKYDVPSFFQSGGSKSSSLSSSEPDIRLSSEASSMLTANSIDASKNNPPCFNASAGDPSASQLGNKMRQARIVRAPRKHDGFFCDSE